MIDAALDAGEIPDSQSFDCPRCAQTVTEPYYGPCQSCRTELRATFAGESRDIVAEAYEPKMNVTPNAVALKD